MKPKTELFLYQMLWAADQLLTPGYRYLPESFEGWAYRNGFLRQVDRLEADGLLEAEGRKFDGGRVHRLTEAGRLAALGGRDPESAWAVSWDRKWRLFLFDVPESERSLRRKLTRTLRTIGCGCLQKSVWLAAFRHPELEELCQERGDDCSHLMILEAESRGPRVDRQMVQTAWDFEVINALYERHMEVMKQIPSARRRPSALALTTWAKEENAAWLAAVNADPLLPRVLLPSGYLGTRAWRQRKTILGRAGRLAGALGGDGKP